MTTKPAITTEDARALITEFQANDPTRTFAITLSVWTPESDTNEKVVFSALPGYDGTSCSQTEAATLAEAAVAMKALIVAGIPEVPSHEPA